MTQQLQTAPAGVPEWTLGWRMQRALAHAGLKVDDIVAEFGVTRGTVSRWMNDRGAAPKPIYLKQWALMTGVAYDWLTEGDTPPRPPAAAEQDPSVNSGWRSRPVVVMTPARPAARLELVAA